MELVPGDIDKIKIVDGKGLFYNERVKFFELGVLVPLMMIGGTWPLLYYIPNNWIGWCFLMGVLLNIIN